jgi:Fe-S cluster assembly scaffold protein SufB
MTSRGLTPQQAQRLVIQGYFNHISDQMSWGMQEKEIKELSSLLAAIQQKIQW